MDTASWKTRGGVPALGDRRPGRTGLHRVFALAHTYDGANNWMLAMGCRGCRYFVGLHEYNDWPYMSLFVYSLYKIYGLPKILFSSNIKLDNTMFHSVALSIIICFHYQNQQLCLGNHCVSQMLLTKKILFKSF